MNDAQILLKEFSSDCNRSFGECVNYLVSNGYDKITSKDEVKKHFTHSKESVPSDIPDDMDIEIPLKRS